MTIRNRDEVGGKLTKAAGVAKETVGKATGNRELQEEGAADRTAGAVRSGVGKVVRKVSNAIDDTADDLKRP